MTQTGTWAVEGRNTTYAVVVGAGILVLIALGIYSWQAAANSTITLIQRGNDAAASTMQTMLEHEFDVRISTLLTLARNPDFIERVRDHDEENVRTHLDTLVGANPNIIRAFVTDQDGTLWSDFPRAPESLGKNFSYREWYRGVSRTWMPYVSNVYRRHAAPQIWLIAIAVPVLDGDTVLGTLVYQLSLTSVATLMERAAPGFHGEIFVRDAAGTQAVRAGIRPPAWFEDDGELFRAVVTTDRGWTIVAQQSTAIALAPLAALRWPLAFIAATGAFIVALLLYLLFRRSQRIQRLNRNLDELNRELAADVQTRRRKYESLLQNLPGMVYECDNDPQWTMRFVSNWCEQLTGYRADELIDNRVIAFGELIKPEDHDIVWREVQRAIKNNQPFSFSYRLIARDGTEKWVWEHGRVMEDGANHSLEGYIHDITAQVSLQRQAEQADKLDSLGSLAGGISHDFNNLLSIILGYTHFLLESIDDEKTRADLEEIREASNRASSLVHQLLAFCRSQKLDPKPLNVNERIGGMENMLRRLLGEDIELSIRLYANLSPVRFDPSQLEQIIINLAVNARDAMPTGGALTIQTNEAELDEAYVESHPEARTGPHVVIAISDTGAGMDEATRERIFEPFYTTKPIGQGTGLGLSTVFGIVRQSGGNIWLYSEPGHGATFKVYLPRTLELEDVTDTEETPAEGSAGPMPRRILVVEDDTKLRRLICRMLTQSDFSAVDTDNPADALQICRRGEVEVMITDVVMPDMGGPELAERARDANPEIRVIFMSGYTNTTVKRYGVLEPGASYLEKPFNVNQLIEAIRQAQ